MWRIVLAKCSGFIVGIYFRELINDIRQPNVVVYFRQLRIYMLESLFYVYEVLFQLSINMQPSFCIFNLNNFIFELQYQLNILPCLL